MVHTINIIITFFGLSYFHCRLFHCHIQENMQPQGP